MSILKRST